MNRWRALNLPKSPNFQISSVKYILFGALGMTSPLLVIITTQFPFCSGQLNFLLNIRGWRMLGFDEYMNLVLEDAEEVNVKKKSRKSLGRILLKGDNITLMMNTGKCTDVWEARNILCSALFSFQASGPSLVSWLASRGKWVSFAVIDTGQARPGWWKKITRAVGNCRVPGRVQGERSHCTGPGAAVLLDSII
ncbi:SMALL NUCLEAR RIBONUCLEOPROTEIN E [Salix viminalis]|uniref:Small nuclear ribonucleoprotein E n=1 Tax=Salix viminalis TaxID=40686 RepID=A0A9Q0ZQI7_SALVM|nr:SMALL NUCLEAR RIBONUCLEOPROTEIN E [Salix viminalis]